ncbi:MAG: response regulator [Flavisolibacter sp.]
MTKSISPKRLVVYADDDPEDLELISEAFNDFSETVRLQTFDDGYSLVNYLSGLMPFQPAPCLIILDVNMPGLNGKQTLQKIRNLPRFEQVPVVLFSTSTLPSEMAFAKSFSAGFLTKPLHTNQIQQIVDQLIEHCSDEAKKHIRKKNSN